MTDENAPCVIFLHIPKAAGMTLRAILQQHYGEDRVRIITARESHNHKTIARQLAHQETQGQPFPSVITGHLEFGLHAHLPHACTYITLLRDPVDRKISSYYYFLRNPQTSTYQRIEAQGLTIEDYLLEGGGNL